MPYNLIDSIAILDDGTGIGSKSANQEWFSTDIYDTITSTTRRRIRVHLAVNTDSVIEYTLDSGTNWVAFNNKHPVHNNCGYEFELSLQNGDLFNIRATQALTVIIARVEVII